MANVIRKGSTYYAPKGAYYEGNVRIDGDFIVPARTHFWGRLVVTGRLELGMKSSVALDVECGSAIIGSHARVKGPLVASGDVTLLDHCVVYSVAAGGGVIIRPDVHVGDVTSSDTIIVHGKIKSGKLTGKNMKVLGN
ncbi:polymer-forming cytoskeletal protein [Methanoregula sp.]|uniref:polymer-forming cytoskeletal protein n=1 Tax=Methanoregula sp. TaxID=2052170 RepID=UPI003BB09116